MIPLEIDLAAQESISDALEQLITEGKIPTILIANASKREGMGKTIEDLSYDNFSRLFEADVAGHFLLARSLVEQLDSETSASIVFLSSIYACADTVGELNKREIAEKLDEMELTISLGWHENVTVEMIGEAIAKLRKSPEQRYQMSKQGRKLIDGYGSSRVLEKMGLIKH